MASPASWHGPSNNQILSATVGRHGSTCLGIDSRGRVGILTNVYTQETDNNNNSHQRIQNSSRGRLIKDFLEGDLNASDYLEEVRDSGKFAHPFNLCLLEPRLDGNGLISYTRDAMTHQDGISALVSLRSDTWAMGNTRLDRDPWSKTSQGLQSFGELVNNQDLGDIELEAALFELMQERKCYFPDRQLLRQGGGRRLSSLFLEYDPAAFSTLSQTVILVDEDGVVSYTERSKRGLESEEWTERRFRFQIQSLSYA